MRVRFRLMFARWRLRVSNISVDIVAMKVCRRRGKCDKVAAPGGNSKAKQRKLKTVPAAAIGDVQASENNKSFTKEWNEED